MTDLLDLLDTIIHEGLHRTDSIHENIRMGIDRPQIWQGGGGRVNLLRESFEVFIMRHYQ